MPKPSLARTMSMAALALCCTLVALPAAAINPEPRKPPPEKPALAPGQVYELDWDELVPPDDRDAFTAGPPPAIHDYLGEGGLAAQQPMNFRVNRALAGTNVKIPGFIVPLDVGKDGVVTEFFLVPYFGACIHVPPPPPNQIVHVRMPKGITLESIYDAYWVTGTLRIENTNTRLGSAAYALAADKVEVYQY